MKNEQALKVQGLTNACRDVCLGRVPSGTIVGLTGENGVEKSAVINMALGLV